MDVAVESSLFNRFSSITSSKRSYFGLSNPQITLSIKTPKRALLYAPRITTKCHRPCNLTSLNDSRGDLRPLVVKCSEYQRVNDPVEDLNLKLNLGFVEVLVKRGVILALILCGILGFSCRRVFAVEEGVMNAGFLGAYEQSVLLLKSSLPKVLQVLKVFKEQGLVLAALLGLSAFFSMAETSITTLWPWKVRELAEKESENGVFKMLSSDVTRFLTTILIGTTVVNIAATALVTDAATAIFGVAGVTAATGVMTVAILLLTEITPKSIAVHNATEVARIVVRPVAWLSLILYPVGRVVTYLSMGMLKMLGLKGRSEPYVTEDELKLMLRGAELSGAIEEEEQDMIENVLEIKDTYVREVMTPLVDVVAIDASATLIDFHNLWVTHQYSRVPVFEQRIDNIVGIAYAMDLLENVQKGEVLESSAVEAMAHKPAYFVPGKPWFDLVLYFKVVFCLFLFQIQFDACRMLFVQSSISAAFPKECTEGKAWGKGLVRENSMSVWNLLREFRIRKVHMAVVLNEYGGTIGIVTLEDVVEEIVGEIFDENDSKEEIQKKTGYIVMRAEGIYDVDANTSIAQLYEDLNIKMPEGHQYETVSGFICEAFGYIPRTGETIKVVLEKANLEEPDEYTEAESDRQDKKERNHIFKLEILAGNARKVSAIRFECINHEDATSDMKVTRLVPKIVKRKSNDDNSYKTDYEEASFQRSTKDDLSDDSYVTAEHEYSHNHAN
ncbi:hypothetical protein LguiB_030238 [Lonicera macranthoides]